MDTPWISTWISCIVSSSQSRIWRLSSTRNGLYVSQFFHLAALLTACIDVHPIKSPLQHYGRPLTGSSISSYIHLEVLRYEVLVYTLWCSYQEWSETERVPNLQISSMIWSERWNFKLKSPVLQCLAKISTTIFLKWLVPYFAIQNLELEFSPGNLSWTHVHPGKRIWVTFGHIRWPTSLWNLLPLFRNAAKKGENISRPR